MIIKKSVAIELWGTAAKLARALKISSQTVHRWPEEMTGRTMAMVLGVSLVEKGLRVTEAYFGDLKR